VSLRFDIAADIAARDRAFRAVVTTIGPVLARRPAPVAERFSSLIRSITYQLLATSAANTIHARVIEACDGEVSVQSVLRTGPEKLRGAGLSRTKAAAMLDLAAHARDGRVNLSAHGRMSDETIIDEVTAVHGVGPWTTQMYLMHTLGRRDVWPVGDFGVRHGWSLVHDLDEMITEKELRARGELFVGVRSDVAWYCWQAVHLHRSNR
jgi:3-methyladenine DNA glycosylase/8-oxoguanine DNA glycosylase